MIVAAVCFPLFFASLLAIAAARDELRRPWHRLRPAAPIRAPQRAATADPGGIAAFATADRAVSVFKRRRDDFT